MRIVFGIALLGFMSVVFFGIGGILKDHMGPAANTPMLWLAGVLTLWGIAYVASVSTDDLSGLVWFLGWIAPAILCVGVGLYQLPSVRLDLYLNASVEVPEEAKRGFSPREKLTMRELKQRWQDEITELHFGYQLKARTIAEREGHRTGPVMFGFCLLFALCFVVISLTRPWALFALMRY